MIKFAISVVYFIELKKKIMPNGFSCYNKMIISLIFICVALRCWQLFVINSLTMVRCLTDVCGIYTLEGIWIFTRGIIAPTRDATELALICHMIYYQDNKNLAKMKNSTASTLDTNQMQQYMKDGKTYYKPLHNDTNLSTLRSHSYMTIPETVAPIENNYEAMNLNYSYERSHDSID
jgi:hypothetical protein